MENSENPIIDVDEKEKPASSEDVIKEFEKSIYEKDKIIESLTLKLKEKESVGDETKKGIIAEYLTSLKSAKSEIGIFSGVAVSTPKNKPKSIYEAGLLTCEKLKKNKEKI